MVPLKIWTLLLTGEPAKEERLLAPRMARRRAVFMLTDGGWLAESRNRFRVFPMVPIEAATPVKEQGDLYGAAERGVFHGGVDPR